MSAPCCGWAMFEAHFPEYYAKWFDTPVTPAVWRAAKRDWRAGNTPWEAAHNAQRTAKERAEKDNAVPLVHLGGKNYAHAGSPLAKRFGKDPS